MCVFLHVPAARTRAHPPHCKACQYISAHSCAGTVWETRSKDILTASYNFPHSSTSTQPFHITILAMSQPSSPASQHFSNLRPQRSEHGRSESSCVLTACVCVCIQLAKNRIQVRYDKPWHNLHSFCRISPWRRAPASMLRSIALRLRHPSWKRPRTYIYGKEGALGSDKWDLAAGIRIQKHVVVLQQGQYSWPNDMRFNLHGPQTPQRPSSCHSFASKFIDYQKPIESTQHIA